MVRCFHVLTAVCIILSVGWSDLLCTFCAVLRMDVVGPCPIYRQVWGEAGGGWGVAAGVTSHAAATPERSSYIPACVRRGVAAALDSSHDFVPAHFSLYTPITCACLLYKSAWLAEGRSVERCIAGGTDSNGPQGQGEGAALNPAVQSLPSHHLPGPNGQGFHPPPALHRGKTLSQLSVAYSDV